jgi:hypothetical protein
VHGKNRNEQDDMKNDAVKNPSLKQPLSPWVYMIISAVCLAITFVFLLVLSHESANLVRSGTREFMFYILLFPLGFSAMAFVFGVMKSYAEFTGQTVWGPVKVTGPLVVLGLVVYGGFRLVPRVPPASDSGIFDITVRVKDSNGQPITNGIITVYYGKKSDSQKINPDGEVNFKEIAAKFRNDSSKVTANVDGFRLAKPDSFYRLSEDVIEVEMVKEPDENPAPVKIINQTSKSPVKKQLDFSYGHGKYQIMISASDNAKIFINDQICGTRTPYLEKGNYKIVAELWEVKREKYIVVPDTNMDFIHFSENEFKKQ